MTRPHTNPPETGGDGRPAGSPPPGSAGLPSGRSVVEWVGAHPDAAIPDRVRVRIFERYAGRCPKCTRKLVPSQWDCDHIVALANGGRHAESNLQPLCKVPCHSAKTADDVAEKSRSYRKRKANAGIRKPRSIRAWRRFNGEPVYASRDRWP